MIDKNYIPKNVYDVEAVKRLQFLPFDTIREDVPKLLEWLQDMHWDVAEGIAKYLEFHVNEIIPHLIFIFETNDGMWKCGVINALIARSQNKLDLALTLALKKLVDYPSKIDAEDGVDEAAKDVLANKILCG